MTYRLNVLILLRGEVLVVPCFEFVMRLVNHCKQFCVARYSSSHKDDHIDRNEDCDAEADDDCVVESYFIKHSAVREMNCKRRVIW